MLWPNGSKTRPTTTPRGAFGNRTHPLTGRKKLHPGVDMVGFSLVRAVADGEVVAVGTPRGWSGGGIQVWVQHDGFFTRSLHLSSTFVEVGDRIAAGYALGVMGATGAVTGVHLHFELTPGDWHTRNSGQIDPVPFIEARLHSTASGGSSSAFPPLPEGKTMSDVKQIHWVKENGAVGGRALLVPGTPWALPFTEAGSTYANRSATQFETGNSVEYTKSMFDAFLRAAERCAPTSVRIEIVDAGS